MAVVDGIASVSVSGGLSPTGTRNSSGRHITMIPNLLARLPVGAAPIAGPARYVAYGLGGPLVSEVTLSPVGVGIHDGEASLSVECVANVTVLRLALESLSCEDSLTIDSSGMALRDGEMAGSIATTLALDAVKIGAGQAALAGVGAFSPSGVVIRSAVSACAGSGSFLPVGVCTRSGAVSGTIGAATSVSGSRVAGGSGAHAGSVSVDANGNVIAGTSVAPAVALSVLPSAGVIRDGDAPMDTPGPVFSPSSVYIAGPHKTLSGTSTLSLSAFVLRAALTDSQASLELAAAGWSVWRDQHAALECSGACQAAGATILDGACVFQQSVLTVAVEPAFPQTIVETYVYASAFDDTLEVAAIETVAYYTEMEDIVYLPTRESIVYGNVTE